MPSPAKSKNARVTEDYDRLERAVENFEDPFRRLSIHALGRGWRGPEPIADEDAQKLLREIKQKGTSLLDTLVFNFANPRWEKALAHYMRRVKNFRKLVKSLVDASSWDDLVARVKKLQTKTKEPWHKFLEYSREALNVVGAVDTEVESTLDVGPFHVVLQSAAGGEWDKTIGVLKWALEKTDRLLKRGGLGRYSGGNVWAFPTRAVPPSAGPGSGSAAASYNINSDQYTIAAATKQQTLLLSMVHEVGHRVYFRYLGGHGRKAWKVFFDLHKGDPGIAGIISRWERWAESGGGYPHNPFTRRHSQYYLHHLQKADPLEALWVRVVVQELGLGDGEKVNYTYDRPSKSSKAALDELIRRKGEAKVFLHPVTPYSAKDDAELFAEVFAHYLLMGSQAVPPLVLAEFKRAVPILKGASRVAARHLMSRSVADRHQAKVVKQRLKAAGWWAVDSNGDSLPPPVDKGGLQNAVPGTDPDQDHYLGDGPLDARITFLEQIDQMYRATWNRPVTPTEVEALFTVPSWVGDLRTWPMNKWVDAAAAHMNVPDSAVLSLPESSITDAQTLWLAYERAYDEQNPPPDVTYHQPYTGEPPEDLLQHFYDHIEASFALHYQDASRFVQEVPADKLPGWARRATSILKRFPEYRGKSKAWLVKEYDRLEEEIVGVGYGPKPTSWVPRSVSNPELLERQRAIRTLQGRMLWQRPYSKVRAVIPARKHKQLVEKALRQGEQVPAEVLADYPDLQGLQR